MWNIFWKVLLRNEIWYKTEQFFVKVVHFIFVELNSCFRVQLCFYSVPPTETRWPNTRSEQFLLKNIKFEVLLIAKLKKGIKTALKYRLSVLLTCFIQIISSNTQLIFIFSGWVLNSNITIVMCLKFRSVMVKLF